MIPVAALVCVLWAVLVALGGALLIFMLAPIRMQINVKGLNVSELAGADWTEFAWQVTGDWLFGAIRIQGQGDHERKQQVRITVLGIAVAAPKQKNKSKRTPTSVENAEPKQPVESKGQRRRGKGRQVKPREHLRQSKQGSSLRWEEVRNLIPEIRLAVTKLWRALMPRARGHLVYGFLDPGMTGLCHGLISIIGTPRNLLLTPEYSEGRLAGWIEARLHIVPLRLLLVAIGTLLRPAVRALWWSRVKAKVAMFFMRRSAHEPA